MDNITLSDFNKIASGTYNAGMVDIGSKDGQSKLIKINNHVTRLSKNNVVMTPERIVAVKELFISALKRGGVSPENIAEIRRTLGISAEIQNINDEQGRKKLLKDRFTPLSRNTVRIVLDRYTRGRVGVGGHNLTSQEMRAAARTSRMLRTDARITSTQLNQVSRHLMRDSAKQSGFREALIMLSPDHNLSRVARHISEKGLGDDAVTALKNDFDTLFEKLLKLQDPQERKIPGLKMCGQDLTLERGDDGKIQATIGKGNSAVALDLGVDARSMLGNLIKSAVGNQKFLGQFQVKNLLGRIYSHDLDNYLTAQDRTSLTRQFAASILANQSPDTSFDDLMKAADYSTPFLFDLAERSLSGEKITREQIRNYHENLARSNAGLPADLKSMLAEVAEMPLVPNRDGGFTVGAPIVNEINPAELPDIPAAENPHDATFTEIKDFVAGLIFSDDTMVAEAMSDTPGLALRGMLTDSKNIKAFAAIMKNPDVLNNAVAPELLTTLKTAFTKIRDTLNPLFLKAYGKGISDAASAPSFVRDLKAFIQDRDKLPSNEFMKLETVLQEAAIKGCDNIQTFINHVFGIDNVALNNMGGITSDPYSNMTPQQIAAQLHDKDLKSIISGAGNDSVPGQIALFKQVLHSYFKNMDTGNKRAVLASALRYAEAFDFRNQNGEPLANDALTSAQKHARVKFTGAILKGTGPLMQKIMQGLPASIMGDYADALKDMKSHLNPIPRKVVQARLNKVIADSNNKIRSIEVEKSLGAASVGEAFLCKVYLNGVEEPKNVVIKIMRHDARQRAEQECKIISEAANKIGEGMAGTWKGQQEQYMKEFDFSTEAANAREGYEVYQVQGKEDHKNHTLGSTVNCMELAEDLIPATPNLLTANLAKGTTLDSFFDKTIKEVQELTGNIFKKDPATGKIEWDKNTLLPKLNDGNVYTMHQQSLTARELKSKTTDISIVARNLIDITKVWISEALFGTGQFHGDCHAGNIMVDGKGSGTLIDFGNMFHFSDAERQSVLRLILGAVLRKSDDFMTNYEKLLSPKGKERLDSHPELREKASAILNEIFSKGHVSIDAVARVQASLAELQKLGLEVPLQVHSFVLSLSRLQNSMEEMNTVLNQCFKARNVLLNAEPDIAPQGQRDELDLIGEINDFYMQKKNRMNDENGTPIWKEKFFLSKIKRDGIKEEWGKGVDKCVLELKDFQKDGEYYTKVSNRLNAAENKVSEAQRMRDILLAHLDQNSSNATERASVSAINTATNEFITSWNAAGNAEEQKAALEKFTSDYSKLVAQQMGNFYVEASGIKSMLNKLPVYPNSFASVVMSTMFNSADVLRRSFGFAEGLTLLENVYQIAKNELNYTGKKLEVNNLFATINNEIMKTRDDTSYKIEIGI